MNEDRWERLGAASGFAMVLFGGAAVFFERTPVTVADFAHNRGAVLTQGMLFLAGGGAALWFLGSLRAFLTRSEGGVGRLSSVAFGAGLVWNALNMIAMAFSIGVASDLSESAPAALLRSMNALLTIANLPLAVMLLAVAVLSIRGQAFPPWLGWVALAAAGAHTVLWFATLAGSGPLAPDGWLSFALYPAFMIWLVPATVIMMKRTYRRQP